MRSQVIGQTGTSVLSELELIQYRTHKRRTVRYKYTKVKHGWICVVVGPFHSRTYGVNAFATTKAHSKVKLEYRLANDYRYIGCLMFSDVDEADTVGIVNDRLWELWVRNCPLTPTEAVGSAGL